MKDFEARFDLFSVDLDKCDLLSFEVSILHIILERWEGSLFYVEYNESFGLRIDILWLRQVAKRLIAKIKAKFK